MPKGRGYGKKKNPAQKRRDAAERARREHGVDGLVWQSARYEGLIAVFVEVLGAFGGSILDAQGRVTVDAPAAVRALTAMRDALREGWVPRRTLTWHERRSWHRGGA